MNGWPNINRARLIRRTLVLGFVTLAVGILIFVLSFLGLGGSPGHLEWFALLLFGGLGLLELLYAWTMRRDQAKADATDAAGDRTAFDRR